MHLNKYICCNSDSDVVVLWVVQLPSNAVIAGLNFVGRVLRKGSVHRNGGLVCECMGSLHCGDSTIRHKLF